MIDISIANDVRVQKLLEIRSRELNETKKQSAVALMVTVLKSLRGNTRVAKPNKGKKISVVDVSMKYKPTWKLENGSRRFCFTTGDKRAEVKPPKELRIYFDKEVFGTKSFYCADIRAEDKVYKYLIITNEASRAKKIVNAFHDKRVNRYKSLAKFALGVSMAKLAKSTGLENVSVGVQRSAFENVTVDVNDSGFSEGEVSIHMKDALEYAGKALKDGEGFVQTAVDRAVNQTVGLIMHKLKMSHSLDDTLKANLESLKQ